MARALRDAGFKVVTVDLYTMRLDGREYSIDAGLVQWQKDAITGPSRRTLEGMTPMAMKVNPEKHLVEFVKEC